MSNLLFDSIKTQSQITKNVLVSFSGGKDSIVTLDLCMKYFDNVIPFFMYLVPNLSFQEKTLQWYEKKYNTKIIRLPHFEVSNFMRYGTFREFDLDVKITNITDIYGYVRQKTGYYWIAAGERINDSIIRRAMIKNSGTIDKKRGRFYPIAYWTKQEIQQYIKTKRLYLSPEQKKIGFSFRSLTGQELSIIKKMYPDDYKKILRMYPFSGAAVKRYEEFGL